MDKQLHPWTDAPLPSRNDFPHNVGGALAYYASLFVHRVTHLLGDTAADILSSVFTRFLRLIEPEMVEYVKPILSDLLAIPDLPPGYRQFLQSLTNPQHEAGAGLLAIVGGTISNVAGGSLMGALTAKATYAVNRASRPALVGPQEATAISWRFPQWAADAAEVFRLLGYPEPIIGFMQEIARPRADIATWMDNWHRGALDDGTVRNELRARGLNDENIELIMRSAVRALDMQDVISAWRRKNISMDDAKRRLGMIGYGAQGVELLLKNAEVIPNVSDIIGMAVRDAWNEQAAAAFGYDEDYPAQVGEWTAKQGLSSDWARRYWRAHWNLPSPQMGFEMMHREIISPEQLRNLLKVADYPAGWRENMMKMSYSPYTRVDVRRMYGLGVLTTREQVKKSYKDLGYDDEKADNMTEFTIRYEDENGGNKNDKYKELTQSLLSQAFREGMIGASSYRAHLSAIKYRAEDIDWLVSYNQFQSALELTPDLRKSYRNEMATILERAYGKRLISQASFKASLTNLGFNARDAGYLATHADYVASEADLESRVKAIRALYVSGLTDDNGAVAALGQLNIPGEMQEKLRREWAFDKAVKPQQLNEAKLKELMKYEVIGLETYCDELRNLGYHERYVLWLRQLWINRTTPAAEAA